MDKTSSNQGDLDYNREIECGSASAGGDVSANCVTRRNLISGTALFALSSGSTACLCWWFTRSTAGADVAVASSVLSPYIDKDNFLIPGGIKLKLINKGNRSTVVSFVRVKVDDHVTLRGCGRGRASFRPGCSGTILPVESAVGKVVEIPLNLELPEGELVNADALFSVPFKLGVSGYSEGEEVQVYRLDVELMLADGASMGAGKFVVAVPVDSLADSFWYPGYKSEDDSSHIVGGGGDASAYSSVDGSLRSDALRSCYAENEVKLRRIMIGGARMSKNMAAVGKYFIDSAADVGSSERSTSSSTESPVTCW